MTDENVESTEKVEVVNRTTSGALLAAIAVAGLLGLAGILWSYSLNSKLAAQQQALNDISAQNTKLVAAQQDTTARLNAATDELKNSLGLTQKQLDARAAELQAREVRSERTTARLATEQQQTAGQVAVVTSDVTNVKTDLANTNSQLTSMKGDLDGHSTLIARNSDELEILKHKGDRNYYAFTLVKGQKKPVGTVSLELKKSDSRKSTYTVAVYSDDRVYVKKDKSLNEPLQFLSGKDPALFEIVVNNVTAKNTVTGYLSTPKSAPVPPVIAER
jgi:hypothetical protein